ncbi:hypothetical protein GQ600_13148 [Phytophthora cactorum]|nr:hypothetical protein GQ600_13148 [Phytophthora cactorum]
MSSPEAGLVPSSSKGVRTIPDNYSSAVEGSSVVTHRLLNDYYSGRCILLPWLTYPRSDVSFEHVCFSSNKDIPNTEDGRTIHDLSAPEGESINDIPDTTQTPDAHWDPYSSILTRFLELRRRYPGCAIYALGADIAEAFHHAAVHARHASAFGGIILRSPVGIVSGMAVFGWGASPGFYVIMGKDDRHYQPRGGSHVNDYLGSFWTFRWVEDIAIIEADIGDRLLRAERRRRDAMKLVFGSDGLHEGKFRTWSQCFHCVGIEWNTPDATITILQRKIDKTKPIVAETLTMRFISQKRLDNLVGILHHIVTFIPVAKPFMQRLIGVQLTTKKYGRSASTGAGPHTSLQKGDVHSNSDTGLENRSASL